MVMYKEMGMYSEMVQAFKIVLKDVHIILYEDFRDNTESEMIKIFEFLGISKDVNIDFVTRHNVGGKRWKNKNMKYIFMKQNLIKSIFKKVFPNQLQKLIRKNLVTVSTNRVVRMNKETRRKLNDVFREDIMKLSEIINRDVTHWTK